MNIEYLEQQSWWHGKSHSNKVWSVLTKKENYKLQVYYFASEQKNMQLQSIETLPDFSNKVAGNKMKWVLF